MKKIPIALKQRVAREFFAKLPKEKQEELVAKAKADAERQRETLIDVKSSPSDPTVIATSVSFYFDNVGGTLTDLFRSCVRNTPSVLSKLSQGLDIVAGLKMFAMVAGPMGMYDGQVGYFE